MQQIGVRSSLAMPLLPYVSIAGKVTFIDSKLNKGITCTKLLSVILRVQVKFALRFNPCKVFCYILFCYIEGGQVQKKRGGHYFSTLMCLTKTEQRPVNLNVKEHSLTLFLLKWF